MDVRTETKHQAAYDSQPWNQMSFLASLFSLWFISSPSKSTEPHFPVRKQQPVTSLEEAKMGCQDPFSSQENVFFSFPEMYIFRMSLLK